MRYHLCDTDVAKLLGAYRTEAEALSLVRTLVAHYGEEYVDDLALGVEMDDGSPGEAFSGAGLLARGDVVRSNRESPAARPKMSKSVGW